MVRIRRGSPWDLVVADAGDLARKFRGAEQVQLRLSTCIKVGSVARPDPSDDQVSDAEWSF